MKSMVIAMMACVYSIASLAQNPAITQKKFHLQAEITGLSQGKAILSYFNREGSMKKEYHFDNHTLNIDLIEKDTLHATIRFLCDELTITTGKGIKQCPHLNFMIVPGETASLKINLKKGKVATVVWKEGGDISHDFVRLNYDLLSPEEKSFNQLIIDNIIQGGDIRNYPKESELAFNASKNKIMTFIRNNPNSYISLMKLAEHYDWFDENEVENIYNKLSKELKHNSYSKAITQRLERSKNFRTGMPANNFEKKAMNGEAISLENLKGKYVLLDFWGSWCSACRESHLHLKELYQIYKNQIVFINVAQEHSKNLDEARKLWQAAVKEDGLTWIQILNNEDREKCDMLKLFNIHSFPTKILIDPNGIIIARWVGSSADIDEVLERINSL